MREESTLAALFSPTRQAVLSATFLRPEKAWYMSELAAHLGVRPSSLQRDVDSLVRVGILEKRVDGRRSYIKANSGSPVFSEIHSLIEKTGGVIPLLRDAIRKLGKKVQWAFVYGSFARSEESADSDVDLMLVGDISMMEMVPILQRLEETIGRDIHPTIYAKNDFLKNITRKNHFLLTVLRGEKIMLKGIEHELGEVARGA